MKVKYEKEQDILYLSFSDDRIFESDEEKKGMEILNASKQMSNPSKVEYEVA
jgi:uncharacterized protein YuzE